MFRQFLAYLNKNKLEVLRSEKILLTVSGGVDSVVMAHLFYCADIGFGIGHCNFKLRGEDADKDEVFVRRLAQELGVAFHCVSFNTNEYATTHKLSVQMAARKLRYDWFEKIRYENKYRYIATAHHKNDSVETMLINLTRGTGIRGLHGILPKKDNLIRPLLFAEKTDIIEYARKNDLTYRTDISNASVKYDRNFIRHKIIPLFQELNPVFIKNLGETGNKLKATEQFFDFFLEEIRKEVVSTESDITAIDTKKLRRYPFTELLLFEFLAPFGFNSTQIAHIRDTLDATSGKTFYSTDYHLIISREKVLIKKKSKPSEQVISLHSNQSRLRISPTEAITIQQLATLPETFKTGKNIALFDVEKLVFPLQIRHWRTGDYLHPLGMHGKKKKIKDLFHDQKLSQFEKEKVWLVTSEGEICWVVGHRIDERFKITPKTKSVIKIIYSKK